MSMRDVLAALNDRGLKKTGTGWSAKCPAHDDGKASLVVGKGQDGRALLKCMAGCELADVLAPLGLTVGDLFEPKAELPPSKPRVVATYTYGDEQGQPLFEKVRLEPKDFRIRRLANGVASWGLADTRRVLYRLKEILAAPSASWIVLCEGEKDADNLVKLGFIATTNFEGAGKWARDYSETLRGRRVVILPDNDDPGRAHADLVVRELAGVAESTVVLRLPGLPPKGDVSDWLASGGTREKLEALVAKHKPALDGFQTAATWLAGEREERLERGSKRIAFGIKFLDEAFGGILPNDLVLVGARTGVGKTELVTSIARYNCAQGRRVHYFALEAEPREIERRVKYSVLADMYYRNSRPGEARSLRYLEWISGDLDHTLRAYEAEADRVTAMTLARLKTHYRIGDFTGDKFVEQYAKVAEETDLVILDHLHYVDTEDDNENRGYKKIVKQIRDSALMYGKPVIVVAHIRKADRKAEQLLPGIEDFHGTSDIAKIATKAVMIAPSPEAAMGHRRATYFQIPKCRTDGSLTRLAAELTFDVRLCRYEDDYTLGKLTDGGRVFSQLCQEDTPAWSTATPAYDVEGVQ